MYPINKKQNRNGKRRNLKTSKRKKEHGKSKRKKRNG